MSDLELSKRLSSVHETSNKSSRAESLRSSRIGSKNVSIAGTPTVRSNRTSVCKELEPNSAADRSNDADQLTSPASPAQIPSNVSSSN